MKKRFITLIALMVMAPLGLCAQNTLTVHQTDGQKFSYGFDEKPVVTFADNNLVITTSKTVVEYVYSSIAMFTFDGNDGASAVKDVKNAVSKPGIKLDEYSVAISGAKAKAMVRLTAADGKLLQSYKADEEGSVTFSISELPVGTYLISSEGLSVKILKR